jgi:2-iminobutanoate/2-iminopropanoate deaminase
MERSTISTGQAPQAIGPYSQAVRLGDTVYCSGQIPLKPDGTMVQGGIADQTRQVLDNLRAVLDAAGSSLASVVKTTVFLKDLGDFAAMNEVYATYFPSAPPARATVQAARLPRDVLVEIDCVAGCGRFAAAADDDGPPALDD